jgi:hypothetical protein
LSIAPTDLKSQYQDELILGFEKTLGERWSSGAKFTYRRLQTAIDDTCDSIASTTSLPRWASTTAISMSRAV